MILAPPPAPPKAPGAVKRLVQQHPLLAYFVAAYSISWLLWLPLVAAAHGLLAPGSVSYFRLLGRLGPWLQPSSSPPAASQRRACEPSSPGWAAGGSACSEGRWRCSVRRRSMGSLSSSSDSLRGRGRI